MPRAVNTPAKVRSRKRLLKKAEGYWGTRKKCLQIARETVYRAEEYMARDRWRRKRDMRRLWVVRLNAACRANGVSYSRFVKMLKDAKIEVNRKMLSELAIHDPAAFTEVCRAAGVKLAAATA